MREEKSKKNNGERKTQKRTKILKPAMEVEKTGDNLYSIPEWV